MFMSKKDLTPLTGKEILELREKIKELNNTDLTDEEKKKIERDRIIGNMFAYVFFVFSVVIFCCMIVDIYESSGCENALIFATVSILTVFAVVLVSMFGFE